MAQPSETSSVFVIKLASRKVSAAGFNRAKVQSRLWANAGHTPIELDGGSTYGKVRVLVAELGEKQV